MEVGANLPSTFCSISKEHSTPSRLLSKAPFPNFKTESIVPAQRRFLGKEQLRVSQVTSAPQSLSCEAVSQVRSHMSQGGGELRASLQMQLGSSPTRMHFFRENPNPESIGTWDLSCSTPFVFLQNSQVLVGHHHHLLEHSGPCLFQKSASACQAFQLPHF